MFHRNWKSNRKNEARFEFMKPLTALVIWAFGGDVLSKLAGVEERSEKIEALTMRSFAFCIKMQAILDQMDKDGLPIEVELEENDVLPTIIFHESGLDPAFTKTDRLFQELIGVTAS